MEKIAIALMFNYCTATQFNVVYILCFEIEK